MKKSLLLLFAVFFSVSNLFGQVYERKKPLYVSTQHRVHLYGAYEKGKDGLYKYTDFGMDKPFSPDDFLNLSDGDERFFAYDKKNNRLYFYSDNVFGYYSPTEKWPMEEAKKGVKKSNVPIVTLEDIDQIINDGRKALDNIYIQKNDSIIEVRRIALEKEREKKIKDSIELAKKKEVEHEEFRKTHDWHELNLENSVMMYCNHCKSLHNEVNMFVLSLSSDTIYYLREDPDLVTLGKVLHSIHYSEMKTIKQNNKFKEYIEIWRDSIALNNQFTNANAERVNLYNYIQFTDEVAKLAPNGYIVDWGWNLNSADGIEPSFSYFNTSNKTIKYVDFYFSIYNAVGDKCILKYPRSYIGNVRGVGPVEPGNYSTWNWDRATHYTTGDASEMRINKIVITYMDKTVKTLTGNAIIYGN